MSKNPDVAVLAGAGFSNLFSIEVRKVTVSTKISLIHFFIVPVIPSNCQVMALSEFVVIETKQLWHTLKRLAYCLQNIGDLSGRTYCKYCVSTVGDAERSGVRKRTII